jgi:hypothetical protein
MHRWERCIPARRRCPRGRFTTRPVLRRADGRFVAIHDSKQSWEQFRDEILMPRLKQGVAGGFKGAPQEQAFEVYNLQS